ncbi:MAG: ABC transporter ATP-binding protein [Lachnospiraceae bacterium]|nr:ABC transporter ATP-binding protein [Lachnospiraceae bacterium]
MENNEKQSLKQMFSNIRFMACYLFRLNKKLYIVRIPMLILQTVSSLVGIYFLGKLLNIITGGGGIPQATYCITLWAGAQGGISILLNGLAVYDHKESERTRLNVRLDLAKAAAAMSLSEVERPYMKDLIALAQSGGNIEEFIRNLSSLARIVIQIIVFSSLVVVVQPWILLIVLLNIVWRLWLQRYRVAFNEKWRVDEAPEHRKYDHLNELLYNSKYGKEIRVNHLVEWVLEKIDGHYKENILPQIKKCVQDSVVITLFSEVLNVITNIVLYLFLSYQVLFQNMRIGDFSVYLLGAEKLMGALSEIMYALSDLMENAVFVKEFRYCMEFSRKKEENHTEKQNLNKKRLSIEFKNVSFRYPDTDREVLSHISFVINPGKTMALVGPNGSGKSTIIKLLCRFYEPTEGEILVGGINIKNIAANEYAFLLGVVFQDYKLFPFTIAENITMGLDMGNIDYRTCIEKSSLKEKVSSLPKQENTFVTKQFDEKGVELSGGESQKLAIARTIYKDSPIVILDEPTAAMDPVTEYEIIQNFDQIVSGKTAVYISHRLSTTRFTDQIIVLQNGCIYESGTHDQLMNVEKGLYKEMFNLQAGYYRP